MTDISSIKNINLIDILYIVIPFISGAFFAAICLYHKFPKDHKVAYQCWSGFFYLIFSSLGALFVTQTLLSMGTKIINQEYLNCFIMSFLSAGLFLGIISKISMPQGTGNPVSSELRTLSDYIYDALESAIRRHINESDQIEIQNLIGDIDPEILPNAVYDLINYIPKDELDDDGKQDMKIKCDRYYSIGDYNSMIRELAEYVSIPHLKRYILNQNKRRNT